MNAALFRRLQNPKNLRKYPQVVKAVELLGKEIPTVPRHNAAGGCARSTKKRTNAYLAEEKEIGEPQIYA